MKAGLLAAGLMLLAVLQSGAAAQGLSGSVANLSVNSDAPIRIEADVLEIDEPQSVATFAGKVRVTQENMLLTTDRLVVKYRASGAGEGAQLQTIDARGSVVMKVDDQVASGDVAHYDLVAEELTLSGKVVLSQGENVIRGEKIVVNLKTGKARMVAASQRQGERVRGVFTPNRRQ